MHPWLYLPALGLACALFAEQPATAQTYNVTDLGTIPGGNFSTALGINQSGQITGWSGTSEVDIGGIPGSAFLYRDGKIEDIGPSFAKGSIGTAIAGDDKKGLPADDEQKRKVRIVGYGNNAQGETYAFLYQDHFSQILGLLPGGTTSIAYAVNDSGEVAGAADDSQGQVQAVIFKDGNVISLGTLGATAGGGEAFGINALGDVTGTADAANGDADGFLYHNGKMIDLGVLPGANSSGGNAINNSLQITGASGILGSGTNHAFLWKKGKMTDLGVLPTGNSSQGSGINASGQIVGGSDIFIPSNVGSGPPGEYLSHGFLYSNGQLQDLNNLISANSGWVLGAASGINDLGEIVGTGTINGETHGYLLKLNCNDSKNKTCEACRK
jgi:probable HAF family extracellular repeat protein